jgi:hypothetical protein
MPDKLFSLDYSELFPALKFMLVQLAYILEFQERFSIVDNPITLQTFAMLLRDSVGL